MLQIVDFTRESEGVGLLGRIAPPKRDQGKEEAITVDVDFTWKIESEDAAEDVDKFLSGAHVTYLDAKSGKGSGKRSAKPTERESTVTLADDKGKVRLSDVGAEIREVKFNCTLKRSILKWTVRLHGLSAAQFGELSAGLLGRVTTISTVPAQQGLPFGKEAKPAVNRIVAALDSEGNAVVGRVIGFEADENRPDKIVIDDFGHRYVIAQDDINSVVQLADEEGNVWEGDPDSAVGALISGYASQANEPSWKDIVIAMATLSGNGRVKREGQVWWLNAEVITHAVSGESESGLPAEPGEVSASA